MAASGGIALGKRPMTTKYISALLLLVPAMALAEDPAAVPAPPDIPPPMKSGEPLEPEVTIIQREEEVVYEYRVNGKLQMVKVVPTKGKPYYYIDEDGDGELELQEHDPRNVSVQMWELFTW